MTNNDLYAQLCESVARSQARARRRQRLADVWTYVWAVPAFLAFCAVPPVLFALAFFALTLVQNVVFGSGHVANLWDGLAIYTHWLSSSGCTPGAQIVDPSC